MADDLEAQRTSWDTLAVGWRKWHQRVSASRVGITASVLDTGRVTTTSKVLDFAAGSGEPGLSAARRARDGEVIACDISAQMLSIGSERAEAEGLAHFRTVVSADGRLPFADRRFDAVVCSFGLEYVPSLPDTLAEVLRVLRPGGRFAVSTWGFRADSPYLNIVENCFREATGAAPPTPGLAGMFRFLKPDDLLMPLRDAGFHDVAHSEWRGFAEFSTVAEFMEFRFDVSPPLRKARAGLSQAKLEHVSARVATQCEAFATPNTGLRLPFTAWVFGATRPD